MQHELGGWDESLCKKKLTEFCHDLPDEGFCVDEWKGRYTMDEVVPGWVQPDQGSGDQNSGWGPPIYHDPTGWTELGLDDRLSMCIRTPELWDQGGLCKLKIVGFCTGYPDNEFCKN